MTQLDFPTFTEQDSTFELTDVLYRQLFERARIIKLVIDPSTLRIVEANPAACEFYGYTHQHLTGLFVTDINVHPLLEIKIIIQKVVSGELPTFETQHRLASGDIRDVEVSSGLLEVNSKSYLYALIKDISQHKRDKDALQRNMAQFQSTFDFAAIGMALVGLDGRWLRVNRALCDIVGYTEAELLAKTFQDITHPDDLDTDLNNVRQLVAGEITSYQMEKRYFHKAGHEVWVLLSVSLVRDPEGKPVHFISQIQNINDRKQAEKALRDSEALYRIFAQNMPNASVVMFDTDMRHTLAEGPFLKTFGDLYKNMLGKTLHEALPQALVESILPVYQRALQGETFFYERVTPNYAYESHVAPIRDADGNIVGGMILTHDTTERQRLEKILRDREHQLRLITDNVRDMIIQSDATNRIAYASPSAQSVLGFTAEAMIGHYREEFIAPDQLSEFSQQVSSAKAGAIPMRQEARLRHADGHFIHVESAGTLLYDDKGNYNGIISVTRDITQRKHLENALREREQELRLITDNINDLVTLGDAQDRITYASPSALTILGLKPEDLLGVDRKSLVHPDDLRIAQNRLASAQTGAPKVRGQVRLRHADGHYIETESAVSNLYDEQGNYQGGVFVTRDITERKRLENALRLSEEQLRLITDNVLDLILLTDGIGHANFVSPSFRTVLGYDHHTLQNVSVWDYVHPDDLERVRKLFMETRNVGLDHLEFQCRMRHANGHYVDAETSARFVPNEYGEFIATVLVIRDITKRKQLETALKFSEERLRSITDNVADLIVLTDGNRHISFASPSYKTILGYEVEKLQNRPILDLVHPNDADHIMNVTLAARSNGQRNFELEHHLRHADGHYIDAETSARFIYGDDGEAVGTVLVTRDVSQRNYLKELEIQQEKLKTALEKEKELSDLKTRMMERIAHEFRTPLTVIQITVETLTAYYERLSPEKRADKVQTLARQIHHITNMLDEISLVIRGTFRPASVHRTTVDLTTLCRHIAHEVSNSYQLPDKFVLSLPETAPLYADPAVLENVFLHLLRNTIRYSKPAAPVHVTLLPFDDRYEIRIADQGIGILPDELARIFDPFFRGTNINEVGGLGIGLTIVRAAIEAHSGTIAVESQLNVGTTFIVTLPC